MGKVGGISGDHFEEAGESKTDLKAVRFVKEKKGEGISAFRLRDVHWEESSFQVTFLAGPIRSYSLKACPACRGLIWGSPFSIM